jgi:quercetin dioxygenase-like cupin family protein
MKRIVDTCTTPTLALATLLVAMMTVIVVFPLERTPPAAATTFVPVREMLVEASPQAASGQELQLIRYTIPPGVAQPMHTHPGTQIAWIETGVLNYVVVEGGEITVTHYWGVGSPEPDEQIGPGESIDLYPGDAVIETEGVVHYGQNLGTEEVVIWAATLLDPDLPPEVVFTPAATPETSPTSG